MKMLDKHELDSVPPGHVATKPMPTIAEYVSHLRCNLTSREGDLKTAEDLLTECRAGVADQDRKIAEQAAWITRLQAENLAYSLNGLPAAAQAANTALEAERDEARTALESMEAARAGDQAGNDEIIRVLRQQRSAFAEARDRAEQRVVTLEAALDHANTQVDRLAEQLNGIGDVDGDAEALSHLRVNVLDAQVAELTAALAFERKALQDWRDTNDGIQKAHKTALSKAEGEREKDAVVIRDFTAALDAAHKIQFDLQDELGALKAAQSGPPDLMREIQSKDAKIAKMRAENDKLLADCEQLAGRVYNNKAYIGGLQQERDGAKALLLKVTAKLADSAARSRAKDDLITAVEVGRDEAIGVLGGKLRTAYAELATYERAATKPEAEKP